MSMCAWPQGERQGKLMQKEDGGLQKVLIFHFKQFSTFSEHFYGIHPYSTQDGVEDDEFQ